MSEKDPETFPDFFLLAKAAILKAFSEKDPETFKANCLAFKHSPFEWSVVDTARVRPNFNQNSAHEVAVDLGNRCFQVVELQ